MKNKEVFYSHLATHWIIYVAYALAAIFAWSYAVVLFTQDKPEEVVTVWVLAYDIDSAALTEKLEDDMPDYLKHVRVDFQDRTQSFANTAYLGAGSSADIQILPESFIAEYGIAKQYLMLDTGYLSGILGDVGYYYADDNAYGIKIFDKDRGGDGLIKYTEENTEKENYYVLINKKSLHMGKLNDSRSSGGIEVIKGLLTL